MQIRMIFSEVSRVGLNNIAKRFVGRKRPNLKSWPNDWVPFHWSRPEKIPGYYNTGDLVLCERPKRSTLRPQYRLSEKLKFLKEDDPTRVVFSLDHDEPYQQSRALSKQHIERLGLLHEVDYSNSLEAKVIDLTYRVRYLQAVIKTHTEKDIYTGTVRQRTANDSARRSKYLKELKAVHVERYQQLLRELQIEHKESPINVEQKLTSRKNLMRDLAIEYSRELREKKVDDFMKSLEEEKEAFQKEKQQTLAWIAEKERELGFTVDFPAVGSNK